jgi:hypothetical protein
MTELLETSSTFSSDGLASERNSPRKATYYMKPETVDSLEDLWFEIRRRVGPSKKCSVTKSLLVQAAVERLNRDLKSASRQETLKILGMEDPD